MTDQNNNPDGVPKLLAPEIIRAVLAGSINKSLSTKKLKQSLPTLWEDQKKMFGME